MPASVCVCMQICGCVCLRVCDYMFMCEYWCVPLCLHVRVLARDKM